LGYLREKQPVVEPEIEEIVFIDTIPEPEPEPVLPPEPKATITVSPAKLQIAEITQIYEEEPLVPVVFFDSGSDILDSRFNPLIETIGERLANNPDVTLELRGFYDPRSEQNENDLAFNRAKSVKRRFVELVPASESRINIVQSGYSVEVERAGLGREAPTQTQQLMINNENRRVEFRLEFSSRANIIENTRTSANRIAEMFGPILESNPDLDLIINGGEDLESLKGQFRFKDEFEKQLPVGNRERVFVGIGGEVGSISLKADGILYRPREIRSALEFSGISNETKIHIETDVPGGFADYEVNVIDDEKVVFETLDEGSGLPPNNLEWDWRDSEGNLIDSRGIYFAELSGIDTLGRRLETISDDTFEVQITEREVVKSKLLIVQFVYDEDVAQAAYLESRLEYVTRKLLEYAGEENKILKVEIAGHTDVLGTERRNIELSKERAEAEYENIKLYLMAILGLNNELNLVAWLTNHDVELTHNGYGQSEPYEITRWIGGSKREVVLGDNGLPEGRTINRRVVIEMELVKEK
jgi:outer membrane protein OmpA-like peptidoglycan-associated protein